MRSMKNSGLKIFNFPGSAKIYSYRFHKHSQAYTTRTDHRKVQQHDTKTLVYTLLKYECYCQRRRDSRLFIKKKRCNQTENVKQTAAHAAAVG